MVQWGRKDNKAVEGAKKGDLKKNPHKADDKSKLGKQYKNRNNN